MARMPGKTQDSIRIINSETLLVPTEHNDTILYPLTVGLLLLFFEQIDS